MVGVRGYIKHGNKMVTKHDPQISGRKNAERIMNLPPGINTGDGGGFDMKLSNRVIICYKFNKTFYFWKIDMLFCSRDILNLPKNFNIVNNSKKNFK